MASEIIVTAEKRDEVINTVPMSITAVSQDQLSRNGITQIQDLVQLVPGFTYTESKSRIPDLHVAEASASAISAWAADRPSASMKTMRQSLSRSRREAVTSIWNELRC